MEFLSRTSSPGLSVTRRLFGAMWRQGSLTPECPGGHRLEGQVALVTGGNAGIGLEIARGLAARGAEVIIAARREDAARQLASQMAAEHHTKVHALRLDLSDLESVKAFLVAVAGVLGTRKVNRFVQNAGVWPTAHSTSAQGHELAFATNVLGHHALTLGLIEAGLLDEEARVVVQTGDIYLMARECTPDFHYESAWGGMLAYCRSKLGNLWFARELQRRFPRLEVVIAHPGVVASGLVSAGGITEPFRQLLLLTPREGAQTALILATQPGLGGAAYYHNTGGHMALSAADPALDTAKAEQLWISLERLRSVES